MGFLKIVLLPFSFIYFIITKFRNHLFDIGYSHSFHFDISVINVGNLRVGGTGKTPHVEYLIRLLKDSYKIATLSRGYGRKTKGIILAGEFDNAKTIGDEPFQFYSKFSKEVVVAVGEERALAIPTILFERPETQLIILDDAYQHRTVIPDFNILLTDYHHPFYEDIVLPAGRLRESRYGAKRANAVIVTKCPESLSEEERKKMIEKIKKYSLTGTPIFFTGIRYEKPRPIFPEIKEFNFSKVVLVSGIANSELLVDEVKSHYSIEKFIEFKDHYDYNEKSIEAILKQFDEIQGNQKAILTTEKDMVKWNSEIFKRKFKNIPVFYLPIEIYFQGNKDLFDKLIFDTVQKNKY